MDDYIDYYCETAMEAQRDYDDFIEEALELHKELKEMDNIVWKNYRELLTWSRHLRSSVGLEVWRKFEKWNDEFRYDVYDLLKSNELDIIDTPYSWEVLPFNPRLADHEYDGSFGDLVHVLTGQSHGILFDDEDNLPDVREYYERGELTYEEIIQVFYRGWQNVQEIRETKIDKMKDFCEQLREKAQELELRMKNTERVLPTRLKGWLNDGI